MAWGYEDDQSSRITRLGVTSGIWPLWEWGDDGFRRTVSFRGDAFKQDLREFLEPQLMDLVAPAEESGAIGDFVLVREIGTQRSGNDFDVEIYNRDVPLFVATGSRPDLVVRNLMVDQRNNRFDATVSLAGSSAAPVVVSGRCGRASCHGRRSFRWISQ